MSKVTVPLKRVVFMGTPDFAVPTLEALVRAVSGCRRVHAA